MVIAAIFGGWIELDWVEVLDFVYMCGALSWERMGEATYVARC